MFYFLFSVLVTFVFIIDFGLRALFFGWCLLGFVFVFVLLFAFLVCCLSLLSGLFLVTLICFCYLSSYICLVTFVCWFSFIMCLFFFV